MDAFMDWVKRVFREGSLPLRAVLMVVYALITYFAAQFLIYILAVVQWVVVLLHGRPNDRLLQFGKNLSAYVHQCFDYLTFNSEEAPFPLGSWPDVKPGPGAKAAASKPAPKKD